MRRVLMGLVAVAVALGVAGPAAADDDPALFAWGYGQFGQLGNGGVTDSFVPVEVVTSGVLAGKRVTSVSGGGVHTCVLAEGKAYCWGSNSRGQLGNGQYGNFTNSADSAVPVACEWPAGAGDGHRGGKCAYVCVGGRRAVLLGW